MNFIKDRANVCKTCTCGVRLKAERVNHFLGFNITVQKNHMIQVASCEKALIKKNRKPIQNHQSKAMLLLRTYTLMFEFHRHLEHMVRYQGIQNASCWWIRPFRDFYARGLFGKAWFLYFSDYKHEKYIIFGQNMIIFPHVLIANHLYFDSGLLMKHSGKGNPLN